MSWRHFQRLHRRRHAAHGGPGCRHPRSLFGRLMLIWLLGLTVVLSVSLWLFFGERARMSRHTQIEHMAMDVVSAVALMDRLPAIEREQWLARLDRRGYHFRLAPMPPGHTFGDDFEHPAWAMLRERLPDRPVALRGAIHDTPAHRPTLYLGTLLADGTPFLVEAAAPRPAGPAPRTLAAMAALVLGVVLLSWVAVRMATRPLSRLARAAQALGEDLDRPPLAEEGPLEVRRAATAFNQMQARIRGLFAERTRILAAVTHDLQTPITRLRLRAELLDDDATRERMLADLADMEALVKEGLAYAGSSAAPREEPVATDLTALVASLVADYADAGKSVTFTGEWAGPVTARPAALRRLLGNLMDNALKFGTTAEIVVTEADGRPTIAVRDNGPGIPEAELDKVLEPFYRVESSRNRETGGTGLGLAIARQLAGVLGAELTLVNLPAGGLEARVTFPRPRAAG